MDADTNKEFAARGGRNSRKNMDPKKARRYARKAARARWDKKDLPKSE